MRVCTNARGFNVAVHPRYVEPHDEISLVAESSAVGEYDDAFDNPGSSFLWIGSDLHLNREEVAQLVALLQGWLADKQIPTEGER